MVTVYRFFKSYSILVFRMWNKHGWIFFHENHNDEKLKLITKSSNLIRSGKSKVELEKRLEYVDKNIIWFICIVVYILFFNITYCLPSFGRCIVCFDANFLTVGYCLLDPESVIGVFELKASFCNPWFKWHH
jgi:hypothetical protein